MEGLGDDCADLREGSQFAARQDLQSTAVGAVRKVPAAEPQGPPRFQLGGLRILGWMLLVAHDLLDLRGVCSPEDAAPRAAVYSGLPPAGRTSMEAFRVLYLASS